MKKVAAGTFILFTAFAISFSNKMKSGFPNEPADPDKYDMSVWKEVKPGVHSGFGSIDSAYSKSIPPRGEIADTIHLRGWRGERVACSLLVWCAGDEEQISIKGSAFRRDQLEISAQNLSISVVKYVLTDEFATGCGPRVKAAVPAHITLDLLSNTRSFTIARQESRPVWIALNIPNNAVAGTYKGSISVQSSTGIINHPISLEVQNKTLPSPSEFNNVLSSLDPDYYFAENSFYAWLSDS